MRFAILGSGAVGGYFGAKLARTGQDVTFIARGAHLAAIRDAGACRCRAPSSAISSSARRGRERHRAGSARSTWSIVSVKAYDNATALPMLTPLVGPDTVVLTLQNGVDSVDEVAAVVGEAHVLGGTTYVATALEAPGLIVQTGVHRSIIFGEVFGDRGRDHAARAGDRRRAGAGRHPGDAGRRRARADLGQVRVPRAVLRLHRRARLPIGRIWKHPHVREMFYAAAREVAAIAAAEGVTISRESLRDAARSTWTTSRRRRGRRC